MKPIFTKIAALISLVLGLITIFAGGSVLLDLFGMRELQGHYILFVVWANFICGFLYVISAFGLFKTRRWAATILGIAFWILIATFIGFIFWIKSGNLYENKTIAAMSFRTVITLALWLIAKASVRKPGIDHVL